MTMGGGVKWYLNCGKLSPVHGLLIPTHIQLHERAHSHTSNYDVDTRFMKG